MEHPILDSQDVESILKRFDRTSPEALLTSLASELVRLHRIVAGLQARLISTEILQIAVDRVVAVERAQPTTELPREISIDAAFSLGRDWGFYELEYDANGQPYRWTGPASDFYFELLLDREKELEFHLYFGQFFVKDPNQSIRCLVDSQEIETQLAAIDGGFEVRGRVPPGKGGGIVLAFACGVSGSPADAGLSGDRRRLGVAFRRLRVNGAPGAPAAAVPDAPIPAQDAAPQIPRRSVRRSATRV